MQNPRLSLADAIRVGCSMSPQAVGTWYDETTGGTCVLSAALMGLGLFDLFRCGGEHPQDILTRYFPILKTHATTPEGLSGDLGFLMVQLNDHHGWTRERIADWVESWEGKTATGYRPTPYKGLVTGEYASLFVFSESQNPKTWTTETMTVWP